MHFIYKAFCDFRGAFFKHITFTFLKHRACLRVFEDNSLCVGSKKCALNGAFDES